jgi:CubicO group peptidase (beta-lactamase class C family)
MMGARARSIVSLAGLAFSGLAFAGHVRLTDPEDVGMSSARLERLTQQLERLVADERASGFQVLVARHGRIVLHEGVGVADLQAGRPVTEDTLFRIASMTKPVVGVAMMMLYEEGYFSLQDPIALHIPELAHLKVFAGMDESGKMILKDPIRPPTIHDLMQHTAGFTYGLFGDTPVDRLYNQAGVLAPGRTQQEFIDTLATLPLLSEPGATWIYSVATDIQGYLIEKWTGMDAGEFLRQRIFEPLGMDETMTFVPPAKQARLAATYTHDAAGKLTRVADGLLPAGTTEPARFSGGGQLISTSDDYWRFCQMLLNGGELDGTRLLSPRSIEMMSHDRLDGTVTIPGWIVEQGFGLNFAVITDPSKVDYPASEGEYFWAGAITTVFFIDPALDIVAILMTQYEPFQIGEYFDLLHRFVSAAVTVE